MPITRTGAGADNTQNPPISVAPITTTAPMHSATLPTTHPHTMPTPTPFSSSSSLVQPQIPPINAPLSIDISPSDNYSSLHSIPISTRPAATEVRSTPELDAVVTSIVTRVFEQQGERLMKKLLKPDSQQFQETDQTIYPQFLTNVDGLDKIPDIVKCLRTFSGEPGEFSSWKKSVQRVLTMYENLKGTPKYYGILNVIRNKITGGADAALESFNTPLSWECIVRCLTTHYADKRDITTLECQMFNLSQGNQSLQQFYQTVSSHLTLIINKISCMDIGAEAMRVLIQTYRDKALETFIRGLKGNLSDLLGMKEPIDLPQALHLCMKYENQHAKPQCAQIPQGTIKRIHPMGPSRSFNPVQSYPTYQRNNVNIAANRPYQPGYSNYSKPYPTPVTVKPQSQLARNQPTYNPQLKYNSQPFNQNRSQPNKSSPNIVKTENKNPQTRNYNVSQRSQNSPQQPLQNSHYSGGQPNYHINHGTENQEQDEETNYFQACEQAMEELSLEDYPLESEYQIEPDLENEYSDIHFLG